MTINTSERSKHLADDSIAIKAASRMKLSQTDRAKLSGDQLALLVAGGSFKDLSAAERAKLSTDQLTLLGIGGRLKLKAADLRRLSATQRKLLGR
jgi:hypothetical protein